MTHAIARKPVHEPVPDIGWGVKFSALCVGAAGLAGAMIWGFSGPIVTPIAKAAGGAMAGTAAKVAEAAGLVNGLKTAGVVLGEIQIAWGGESIASGAHTNYILNNCSSFMQDPACFASGLRIVAGTVAVCAACAGLVVIAKKLASKI